MYVIVAKWSMAPVSADWCKKLGYDSQIRSFMISDD